VTTVRAVLTIAGSDSIAGAGIQADLKTFAALGVFGTSAMTAVTAQNTTGVGDVFALPPQLVRSQIESVAQDIPLAAVKTGMLATAEIVRVVAEAIARFQPPNLVVDPVMAAGTPGRRTLLAPEAVSILKTRLLPVATIVTPNVDEASVLSGMPVDSLADAREAARRIHELGAATVVIKGGHLPGPDAIDLFYDGRAFTEFSGRRVGGGSVHGTGCTFAAALAAGLALGDGPQEAVQRAKQYVAGALEHSFEIGHGARLLDHFWQRLY
jgi:hydroxymethylpyrimidine/phosphomethylpyrimidine kinase